MERKHCRACGMESRNWRYEPITNGLCASCKAKEEQQAKDARLSKLQAKATLKRLNSELSVAIISEEYGEAAKLRDKIKAAGG